MALRRVYVLQQCQFCNIAKSQHCQVKKMQLCQTINSVICTAIKLIYKEGAQRRHRNLLLKHPRSDFFGKSIKNLVEKFELAFCRSIYSSQKSLLNFFLQNLNSSLIHPWNKEREKGKKELEAWREREKREKEIKEVPEIEGEWLTDSCKSER